MVEIQFYTDPENFMAKIENFLIEKSLKHLIKYKFFKNCELEILFIFGGHSFHIPIDIEL